MLLGFSPIPKPYLYDQTIYVLREGGGGRRIGVALAAF
jgi:hypothetical protein